MVIAAAGFVKSSGGRLSYHSASDSLTLASRPGPGSDLVNRALRADERHRFEP